MIGRPVRDHLLVSVCITDSLWHLEVGAGIWGGVVSHCASQWGIELKSGNKQ